MPPQAGQEVEVVRRTPVTQRQFDLMLSVLIRHMPTFKTSQMLLTPEKFAVKHKGYAALWAVVGDYQVEFNDLPNEEYVASELERRLEEDPDAMTDEGLAELDEFLRYAYVLHAQDVDQTLSRVALKFLKQYLEDRLSDGLRTTISSSTYTPVDMCSILEHHRQEHAKLGSLDPVGLSVPFPDGWEDEGPQVIKLKTGIPFFDQMLNGGQANGEVYGLLGPSGSCKTTFAVQYATCQATNFRAEWRRQMKAGIKTPLPIVYYFFYEATVEEFRVRSLSAQASIHREILETAQWDKMSCSSNLKPYERRRWAKAIAHGHKVLGEHERFKQAQKVLNLNLRFVDMTGNDKDHPGRGWNMVPEISQIVRMDQDHRAHRGQPSRVGAIIVDYAGAAVKRFLDYTGKDYQSNIRHYVGSFGMQCKNNLAIAFDCPVLAMHQLSGKANELAAGILPGSTAAAEAKNWQDNLDFSCMTGNPNGDNFAVFGCDKTRRGPPTDSIVIKITGELGRVDQARDFVVDPVRRMIVNKDDMRSVEDDEEEEVATDNMQMNQYKDNAADDAANIAANASSGTSRSRRRPREES